MRQPASKIIHTSWNGRYARAHLERHRMVPIPSPQGDFFGRRVFLLPYQLLQLRPACEGERTGKKEQCGREVRASVKARQN
jgi:hypothetical protein